MNLLEHAIQIQNNLDNCMPKEFARLFIMAKDEFFHLYNKGLINSSSHGIDYFKNIINYWDNPDSYCDDEKNIYEYNFVKLLKQNKQNVTKNF